MALEKSKNVAEKPLTSVMEDYLEVIYDLDKNKKVVRVKDIAKKLDVKMPTVTSMLKTLSSRGLIHYEKYEYVELTKTGGHIGREMQKKHQILRTFLTDILKVEYETADEEACKMEHALSDGTLSTLTEFMEFIQKCPRTGENWLQRFEEYKHGGCVWEKCSERTEEFISEFHQRIDSLETTD